MTQFSMDNDFTQLRREADLRQWCDTHLDKRGRDNYVCPWPGCNSGNGPKKTAAFYFYVGEDKAPRVKCQSCGRFGDIVDLVKAHYNIENTREAVLKAAEDTGVKLDSTRDNASTDTALTWDTTIINAGNSSLLVEDKGAEAQEPADELDEATLAKRRATIQQLNKWREAMTPTCDAWQYLRGRGFTDDDVARFGFGYDEHAEHRLIIPYSYDEESAYYIRRNTQPCEHGNRYRKPGEAQAGKEPLMNPTGSSIWDEPAILIVEGALDIYAALSVDVPAVAIVTANATQSAIKTIKEAGYKGDLIVALDMDERGRQGNERLIAELQAQGLKAYAGELPAGYKDLGDALEVSHDEVARVCEDMLKARYIARLDSLGIKSPLQAVDNVISLKNYEPPLSTGFRALDTVMGGGLTAGLVTVAAESSTGKTTLFNNVAENIAATGKPVFFASLEQTAEELASMTLARFMSMNAPELHTISARDLTDPLIRAQFDDKRRASFDAAVARYREEIAPHIAYYQPENPATVNDIAAAAYAVAEAQGEAPVVIVDYLQIIAALDNHDDDRRTIDKAIIRLRKLAKHVLNAPVVLISSMNRQSYGRAATMAALKGSNTIEYSSDVVLALSPYHMSAKVNECRGKGIKEEDAVQTAWRRWRAQDVRDVGVSILKNRKGRMMEDELEIYYAPAASRYLDAPEQGAALSWDDATLNANVIKLS